METIQRTRDNFYHMLAQIQDRKKFVEVMGLTEGYEEETKKLIEASKKLKEVLVNHYNVERLGTAGTIESVTNYVERMRLRVELDDAGNEIKKPRYKLGVDVIDSEWLNNEGVTKACMIGLGADSGVGKTEISLMFMQSFVKQGRKVLFSSLEMGDQQLYDLVFQEGKFDSVLANSLYSENIFLSFDTSRIDDLSNAIMMAHHDKGIDVFVIDSYLPIETGFKNSRDNMDAISKMLDEMKRTLNITIVIIAQWSKADSKEGYYDFSGGTTLKYLSDFVLFIEKFENKQGKNTMRKITCAKNRIFPKFVDNGIITDYDYASKKIVKVCDSSSAEAEAMAISRDKDGKILRSLPSISKKL